MLESLFNKVAGLKATLPLQKKRLQHRPFSVNIAKYFRTAFFKEHRNYLRPGIQFYLSNQNWNPYSLLIILQLLELQETHQEAGFTMN